MDLGIGFSEDVPVASQQRVASHVEAAGFRSLWVNEGGGRDALLLCQALAAATTDLEVGVGVAPLWTRSAAQLAAASATLQEASGGRFLLGIGVGHPASTGRRHGVEVVRPLTAVRETVEIVRQLESGQASDVDGQVRSSRGFRLGISPRPPATRIYVAALGPQMVALAGKIADGVLLNWCGPEEAARQVAAVRDAARAAGRDPDEIEVASYVRMTVHPDLDLARAAVARQVAQYAALPSYQAHFERQGVGERTAAAAAARQAGDDAALVEALGDEALATLGWAATPGDDPGPMLASYREAGLDHLVARVVRVDDPVDDVTSLVRALDVAAG